MVGLSPELDISKDEPKFLPSPMLYQLDLVVGKGSFLSGSKDQLILIKSTLFF